MLSDKLTNCSSHILFYLAILITTTACTNDPNYVLTQKTAPSASAYAGEPFAVQPIFQVTPFSGTLSTEGDNFKLVPYFDSACSTPADGSLTAFENPASVSNGTIAFSNLAYAPPAHTEEKIYLRISGGRTALNLCTPGSINVFQRFSTGAGNVVFGTTSAAGSTGATEIDSVKAFAVDAQGRYVVTGTSLNLSGGYQLAIWRYNLDGTLDTTFGAGMGYIVSSTTGAAGATGASEIDSGNSIAIDSSGLIIIAGTSANTSGGIEQVLWRFNSDGSIDTNLGSGAGYVISGATGVAGASGASETESVAALKIDSQGNYLILGSSKNSGGGTELALWRYTSAGALDTSFASTGSLHSGTTGLTGATSSNEFEAGKSFQIDGSGNILISGSSQKNAGGKELALWRYTSAGALDTTFASSGHVIFGSTGAAGATGTNESDSGNAIQLDSASHIVVGGTSANGAGGVEIVFWRYTLAGVLDTAFHTTGYALSGTTGAAGATGAAETDLLNGFQIDAQGNFVAGGSSKNIGGGVELTAWRFLPTGSLDTSFASGAGFFHFGTTGAASGATGASEHDVAVALQIDSYGRITLAGTSVNVALGQSLALWRYTNAGALDL